MCADMRTCVCARACACVCVYMGDQAKGLRIRISIPRFQVYLGLLSHPPGPTAV